MKVKLNTDEIRSAFDSQIMDAQIMGGELASCNPNSFGSEILNKSNSHSNFFEKEKSNFFVMNDKDDKLLNDLRFKDIFVESSKENISIVQSDEIKEESWRYNRRWLSAVFVIWFFLAVALLANAIYY